jgi:hypothetical protein
VDVGLAGPAAAGDGAAHRPGSGAAVSTGPDGAGTVLPRRPAASAPRASVGGGGPPAPVRAARTGVRLLLHLCQAGSDLAFAPLARRAAWRLAPATGTPPHFVYVLLAVEDKRFLLPGGVDPLAAARAAASNLLARGSLQGASTITQQLYNVERAEQGMPRTRTLATKWRQGAWAVRAGARYSKPEVLRTYLDRVYWGRSFRGLDQAAAGYCGTRRDAVTVAQSFFLVERLATPNVARPRRVAILLTRRALAPLFRGQSARRAELLALYERHFAAAAKIRRELAARGAIWP